MNKTKGGAPRSIVSDLSSPKAKQDRSKARLAMSVATNAGWMDTTLILPFSASAMDSLNLRRQQAVPHQCDDPAPCGTKGTLSAQSQPMTLQTKNLRLWRRAHPVMPHLLLA